TRFGRVWAPDFYLPKVARVDGLLAVYHAIGRPSWKKPSVGPSSLNSAAQTTPAAPSATGRPPCPMSVSVQPGQTALTRMPSRRNSAARIRVIAFSAALETL